MRDGDVLFFGHNGAGKRGVDVADDEYQSRVASLAKLLKCQHDFRGLLRMGAASRSHAYVRLGDAQLFEKYIVHLSIIVLAGMDDREPEIAALLAQGAYYRGNLHEIRPCAGDDGNRLHRCRA